MAQQGIRGTDVRQVAIRLTLAKEPDSWRNLASNQIPRTTKPMLASQSAADSEASQPNGHDLRVRFVPLFVPLGPNPAHRIALTEEGLGAFIGEIVDQHPPNPCALSPAGIEPTF